MLWGLQSWYHFGRPGGGHQRPLPLNLAVGLETSGSFLLAAQACCGAVKEEGLLSPPVPVHLPGQAEGPSPPLGGSGFAPWQPNEATSKGRGFFKQNKRRKLGKDTSDLKPVTPEGSRGMVSEWVSPQVAEFPQGWTQDGVGGAGGQGPCSSHSRGKLSRACSLQPAVQS